MAIAGSVDRLQHLGREPRGFLQDTFDVIDREVRINAVVDSALEFADVAHHEQHLVDGRAIGHGVTSTSPSALASTAPGRGVARGVHSLEIISCVMSSALETNKLNFAKLLSEHVKCAR